MLSINHHAAQLTEHQAPPVTFDTPQGIAFSFTGKCNVEPGNRSPQPASPIACPSAFTSEIVRVSGLTYPESPAAYSAETPDLEERSVAHHGMGIVEQVLALINRTM